MLCVIVCGCCTVDVRNVTCAIRFYAEIDANSVVATLPISKISIRICSQPILTEFDLQSIELRDGVCGKVLIFVLSERSAFDLFALSVQNANKKIICEYNGNIIGMTMLTDTIYDGVLIVYPEKSDDELVDIVNNGRAAISHINKIRKNY